MKMKAFKLNGYRAQGELTVLVPPTTPFERGAPSLRYIPMQKSEHMSITMP